jgi:exodeoxyribonuclease V alpha subunit
MRQHEFPISEEIEREIASASLEPEQKAAVRAIARQQLTIITGGPGTGKSYTAGQAIRILSSHSRCPVQVAIAAPTGRAAAHLESALRFQGALPSQLQLTATTLHRLLQLSPGQQHFADRMPINADFVFVDEASMIDLSLLLHLLDSVGAGTRVVLLGDVDQLPPVEAGSVFPDLAEVLGVPLQRSRRMGEGTLYTLAQAVRKGSPEEALEVFQNSEEAVFNELDWSCLSTIAIAEQIASLLPNPVRAERPDPESCLAELAQRRILCGLRQGPFGVDEINRVLERRSLARSGWRITPILISRNAPRLNLYNGTWGVLVRRSGERHGFAYFHVGHELVTIEETALPDHELAFCISVHKSQGSEFEEVVALFPPGSERFGREALYTAMTRAKKRLALWTDASVLRAALASSARGQSGVRARLSS